MSAGSHRPPPTVLLRQDQYEPFGEKICLEKLQKVGRTSDSIRKTAAWVFHHRDHLPKFVKIWIAEFRRASPSRRLNLYYVAHETLALCKKKKFDKGFSCFQSVLREATVYSRDKECKVGVRKVFSIFADAAFFPEEFLMSLREDLERGKSTVNYNKTVLADFDPAVIQSINDHMEEFRDPTLAKLEAQYAERLPDLEIGPEVISKIKEHAMGKEHLQQFDSAFVVMTELADARDQDLKYEYDLLNQLELLRVYYSTTTKEADKVIIAYRNYESAAQNGMKKLEKASSLQSIPLPGKGTQSLEAAQSVSKPAPTPVPEIETVDMDMEMSDEDDAVQAAKAVPSQPIMEERAPQPEAKSPATSTTGQPVSFESAPSTFSFPQHSAPPFGLLTAPHQRPPAPSTVDNRHGHFAITGGPLSPQLRAPNFRPTSDYQTQSPSRPALLNSQMSNNRFLATGPPMAMQQQRHPGSYDQSNRFPGAGGGFQAQQSPFSQNGNSAGHFSPSFDNGGYRPVLGEPPGGQSRRNPDVGSNGASFSGRHPTESGFPAASSVQHQRPSLITIRDTTVAGSPENATNTSSGSSPAARAPLNFDEDNFNEDNSNKAEGDSQPSSAKKFPLISLPPSQHFTPPENIQSDRQMHQPPERSPLLQFTGNPGNFSPTGQMPRPRNNGPPPGQQFHPYPPQDFRSLGPFRPQNSQFLPQRPPDFRQQHRPTLPGGMPNGGQFYRQGMPPLAGRFTNPGLLSSPPPRGPFFPSDEQRDKPHRFPNRDVTGGNLAPVAQKPVLGGGGGADDENISLTERLRRLSQTQAASSNIVLTSPAAAASPVRGFQPRR